MTARSILLTVIATFLLGLLIFGAARLILPACGTVLGWFNVSLNFCPVGIALADETVARERDLQADLLARIARLEAAFSDVECIPQQATVVPDSDQPDFADNSDDQRRFDEGDVSVLNGCWQLQQSLRFTHRDTGAETNFNQWQMCFDAQGNGSQIMRSTDGRVVCEGDVPGDFNGSGSLIITEPGNLQCSDGTFIYRRDITCDIDENGFLACQARQPEVNSNNEPFRMQREQ